MLAFLNKIYKIGEANPHLCGPSLVLPGLQRRGAGKERPWWGAKQVSGTGPGPTVSRWGLGHQPGPLCPLPLASLSAQATFRASSGVVVPSIPERKEAKLAGGGTRREQCVSRSDSQLVNIARWKQGPRTPSEAVFLRNGRSVQLPGPLLHNQPLKPPTVSLTSLSGCCTDLHCDPVPRPLSLLWTSSVFGGRGKQLRSDSYLCATQGKLVNI